MLMKLNVFSTFKFDSDCIEALFYKIKIDGYGVSGFKKEKRKEYIVHFQEDEM